LWWVTEHQEPTKQNHHERQSTENQTNLQQGGGEDEGSGRGDIGIPKGPAEDGTRGLLKADDSKNKKNRKPKLLLRKARVVLGDNIRNVAG
jgi:hypothetical protein